eukprot:5534334-Pyramimonas_sp.AAC.1
MSFQGLSGPLRLANRNDPIGISRNPPAPATIADAEDTRCPTLAQTRLQTGLVLKWLRMGPLVSVGSESVGTPILYLIGLPNGLAYLVPPHMVALLGPGNGPRKPPQESLRHA